MSRFLATVVVLLLANPVLAQTVDLHHHDAEVWSLDQTIRGFVSGAASGVLHLNDETTPFDVTGGAFEVALRLRERDNIIVACAGEVCSDTLRWTLGYEPRPEVHLEPDVSGREVTLHAHVRSNPLGQELTFEWEADVDNPTGASLSVVSDSVAVVTLPEGVPEGEYYFEVRVSDQEDRVRRARTFVTVTDEGVTPFDIHSEHASWIDEAVLYEIAPWYFARNCVDKFACIEDKIPEIASLGVTTIWLQPIYPNAGGGQAYDVTDYFGIWDRLGNEESLRSLIQTAKDHELKVILDFVPNHSSIEHPYAEDAAAHGEESHYWDFYMREFDDAPYSNHYNRRTVGKMPFVYYFWDDLVTFNLQNEETQRYLTEAARYWIEEFDVDGYRLDAVWAPNARNPEFMHQWRIALKSVKPEILLLAEDKASRSDALPADFPSTFENFDVAYDWTPSDWCLSGWAWEWPGECNYYPDVYGNTGPKRTIFNYGNEGFRSNSLRDALTNDGDGFDEDAVILRFMENNDMPRFIEHHTLEQTRAVAALTFTLDGVPMLYYGQESGLTGGSHPWPTIPAQSTIRSFDRNGLWSYYQHLIGLRRSYDALTSRNFEEIDLASDVPRGRLYAYRRWADDQNILAMFNLGSADVSATLTIPVDEMNVGDADPIYLTDLLTGDYIETDAASLAALDLVVPGHSAFVYAVADSIIHVTVDAPRPAPGLPGELVVHQNYPNPFSDRTAVIIDMPTSGEARLEVFDILGRRVVTLVDRELTAGRHEVALDARSLASGTYIYRVTTPSGVASRQMMVVR